MSDPFLAEIKIAGFNFAPAGFAFCQGQILPISQNTALFSLLGTNYGGDGRSTFGLPNLQGMAPIHAGASGGPGLTPRSVGETGGAASVTLQTTQLPGHGHALNGATLTPANPAQHVAVPTAQAMLGDSSPASSYSDVGTPSVAFSPTAIGPSGGGQPHNNLQPVLVLNFVIALQGVFPSRS